MTRSDLLWTRLLLTGFFLLALLYAILPALLARFLYTYGLYENGKPIW